MKHFPLASLLPRLRGRWAVTAALAVGFAFVAGPAPQARADREPTPAQLTAAWWQWILSIPAEDNPGFDDTGANALVNQPYANKGLVFLCGSFVSSDATRAIRVPAGTSLFFPVVNSENDEIFYDRPVSVRRLRADAAATIDGTYDRHAELNGIALTQVRLESPVFRYKLPAEGNIYQALGVDVSGTISPAVSDGYWCYTQPLPAGDYTLTFGATIPSSTPAQPPFTFNITYVITVE
jgi:hypothetical protein